MTRYTELDINADESVAVAIRNSPVVRVDVAHDVARTACLYDVPREYRTWSRWIKRLNTGRGSSEWSRP